MPSRGPLGKSLRGILVIFVFLALFLCLPVLSGPQKGFSVEKRQAIENAVAGFMARNNIPGLSAAVVLNGGSSGRGLWHGRRGELLSRRFLHAFSSRVPFQTDRRDGSARALRARRAGPRRPCKNIVLRSRGRTGPSRRGNCSGVLGGIRHYNPDGKGEVPEDSARHFASIDESLALFSGDPLVAKPGTNVHSSTYGYTLVGCVG